MVRNRMILQKLQRFVTWRAGISTVNIFLLQGVDRNWHQASFFYLAPHLICEGYWQVNSRRSIFCIVHPNYCTYSWSSLTRTFSSEVTYFITADSCLNIFTSSQWYLTIEPWQVGLRTTTASIGTALTIPNRIISRNTWNFSHCIRFTIVVVMDKRWW